MRNCGDFRRFPEESRRVSLQLRLSGGGCSHERTLLSLNSLLTGEKTGIFIEFRQRCLDLQSCKRCICGGLWSRERFLVLPKAGNFFIAYQGIKIAYQGIKVVYQGTAFLRSQRREGESETDAVIEECRSPSVRRSS